jgi:phosphoribosylformimino-5-aminoimidazole carboxamide ribotide isomerase
VAAVIFFPAIDLKDGQCVRLERGDMSKATVFNADPAAQAGAFAAAGCEWLHVVDLNGAFAGKPVNDAAVRAILAAVQLPIQLGGGIRERATVDRWLALGVRRVILGTAALKNPALVKEACRAHPGRIAVGVDARDGRVAVEGWAEVSTVAAGDLARRFEDAGVAALIHTDIARDGMLKGPNVAATVALAQAVDIPVIASGGVSSLGDLRAIVEACQENRVALEGVISGRAVYDGRLDPRKAVRYLKRAAAAGTA